MKKILLVASVAAVTACAQSPERIAALHRDPAIYRTMSCADIQMRRDLNASMIVEYSSKQRKAHIVDGVTQMINLPPLATWSGADRSKDIAHMRGEQYALLLVALEKDCTIT